MKFKNLVKMRLLNIQYLALLAIFIIIVSSCKTSTEPSKTSNDITGHEFTWRKITFTGLTPKCISIINKNDIWIAGNSSQNFSVLHWDGNSLQKISIIDYQYHNVKKYFSDFVALSDNDIYFLDGNVFHSDGATALLMYARDNNHNEFFQTLWMENPGDIYVSGRKSILHFDGRQWVKIAVPGDDPVIDIWGTYFSEKQSPKIIGLISSLNTIGIRHLFTISNEAVKDTLNWPDDQPVKQIWFDDKSPVYVCSTDLWQYSNGNWKKVALDSTNLNAIHGSGWNNIFVVGNHGYVAHFNGLSWKTYPQFNDVSGEFEAVRMKEQVVAIAGQFARQGNLLIGIQK